ncbi:hypothetical protein PPL_06896 [Heterostelium album PN500]|uniref:C2 domain-containing protein n=1 Tax=Heterostelium pallidum (strain ATCC 26659 / Pp 5 / PN500) TaxID=670386 RepID=D3BDU3_HETP5|nr:hypothetical protein PPL_06896 [Heterostelium album PN500]EFA80074.1 hypothetical protein PPL_06896 [Heterostelium album PN500]|eukprot:XP_020432194.1 hypothetical protein PPL_06896 [Heterostelium album PN500]
MGSNTTAANLILRKHIKDHGYADSKTLDLYFDCIKSDAPKTYKGTKFEGCILYKFTIGSGEIKYAQDPNGLADGYCRIGKAIPGLIGKKWLMTTDVKEKTLSPFWFKEGFIRVNVQKRTELHLEMWDKDLIKDDFIGSAIINLNEVTEYRPVDKYYTITDSKGKETGKVFLSIRIHKKFDY